MAGKNAIVRRLPAIETLSAASAICMDKTGTLTRQEMMVASLAVAGQAYTVAGDGYAPTGGITPDPDEGAGRASLEEFARVAALCNDASLIQSDRQWDVSGNPA